jgi:hypothetical protein
MAYSATSNSPISYSIDWNSAANSAGLSDQASTPFSFLSGGGTLTGINISANVAASFRISPEWLSPKTMKEKYVPLLFSYLEKQS